jgi:hypothetical protein
VVTRNYITKHEEQKDDGKHVAHCHHCHVLKQYKRAKKEEERKGNGHTWCCLLQIDKTTKKHDGKLGAHHLQQGNKN